MGRILIADDHDALRRGLARALTAASHEVEEAPNGNQAIERLHEGHFDVVLSDLKMGGSDGLDVLRTTKTLHPSTAVILMTAFGSVHTAVEAMKIGAFDYVQKPFEIEEMEVKIEKALEMRRMRHELDYLRHTQNDIYDFDRIIGTSEPLQRVLGVVRKVAKSNTTVLIRGETGTGKELIAGAIHHNSLRGVAELRQSELRCPARDAARIRVVRTREGRLHRRRSPAHRPFRAGRRRQPVPGRSRRHERGDPGQDPPRAAGARVRAARRHAHAEGGRAADRRDQPRSVADGRDRLSSAKTSTTGSTSCRLRCRRCASARKTSSRSAMFFVRKFGGELKKKVDGIDPEAQKMLLRYNWPGNIRELENSIERAILMTEGQFIASDDLRLGEIGDRRLHRPARGVVAREDSAVGRAAGRDRAQRADGSAEDVELGAEGCGRAARHQPARDELQDQDAAASNSTQPPAMVAAGELSRTVGQRVQGVEESIALVRPQDFEKHPLGSAIRSPRFNPRGSARRKTLVMTTVASPGLICPSARRPSARHRDSDCDFDCRLRRRLYALGWDFL